MPAMIGGFGLKREHMAWVHEQSLATLAVLLPMCGSAGPDVQPHMGLCGQITAACIMRKFWGMVQSDLC